MSSESIAPRSVKTLQDFYDLMAETREVRARAVRAIMGGQKPEADCVPSLETARGSLAEIPSTGEGPHAKRLALVAERMVDVDLTYEVTELDKDLLYLKQGEDALMAHMEELHQGFRATVAQGRAFLGDVRFRTFFTDRDGTTNNYCGRYRSSIQSIYNGVLLTRFAKAGAGAPVMLTSAPLRDIGIVDVSVMPEDSWIYAASKGRECIGKDGERRCYPIEPGQQQRLLALYEDVRALVETEVNRKFALIGSGLQFKFGQITVARQDISGSVPEEESLAFLESLKALVDGHDPDGREFRIEDTGKDVEIILTIEGDGALKDFDKGDGVAFIDDELGLGMDQGPNLVCGDTGSDVPMAAMARTLCEDTAAIFVTRDAGLMAKVRKACPRAFFVPEPDMLVAILGTMDHTDNR